MIITEVMSAQDTLSRCSSPECRGILRFRHAGTTNTERLGNDCKLWLEKHVLGKDRFWPSRPVSEIKLGLDGVPELHLTPANPERIKELQVYECLKGNRPGALWVLKAQWDAQKAIPNAKMVIIRDLEQHPGDFHLSTAGVLEQGRILAEGYLDTAK